MNDFIDYKHNVEYQEIVDEFKTEYKVRALEIIKEKNVDTALLKHCKSHTEYNVEIAEHNDKLKIHQDWWHRKELTQDECNLLKEVFE